MVELFANSGDLDLRRLIWVCFVCQFPVQGSPVFKRLKQLMQILLVLCSTMQSIEVALGIKEHTEVSSCYDPSTNVNFQRLNIATLRDCWK